MSSKTASTSKANALNACSIECATMIVERTAAIEAQLDVLKRIVANHSKGRLDWGHAGNLGMVQAKLDDLLSGFSAELKA